MNALRLTIGQYYPQESPIHQLDARLKLVVSLLYMVTLFISYSWPHYIILTAVFVVCFCVSKIPFVALWRGLRMIMVFIVISMIFNFFLIEGHIIWQWGFIHLTQEGLTQGLKIGVRLILLVFFASLLTLTTKPLDLTDGMERLLNPLTRLGLPVHELAMMIAIALRFIPTILQEYDRVKLAQKARGASFSGRSLKEKLLQLMPILIPLFIGAFRRADELALAMDARCYRGHGRSRWKSSQWRFYETCVFIGFIILFIAMIYLRLQGGGNA